MKLKLVKDLSELSNVELERNLDIYENSLILIVLLCESVIADYPGFSHSSEISADTLIHFLKYLVEEVYKEAEDRLERDN